MQKAFHAADIMLPLPSIDMSKWSVIACDQHTSEPEYWEEVRGIVGESPSTLSMILPEVYLEDGDMEQRLDRIHRTMEDYIEEGVFRTFSDAMILLERTESTGLIHYGLVGCIDLEEYDFSKGSHSEVRATEQTVPGRLPPRVHIREKAILELPHIMMLIDDEKKQVIEPAALKKDRLELLYDYDLMLGGGHVRGYLLPANEQERILASLDQLADPDYFQEKYRTDMDRPMIYAMGDGNHSLASAKVWYEDLKKKNPDKDLSSHPARYALVELMNLHSPSLVFDAIHRIITGIEPEDFMKEMTDYLGLEEMTAVPDNNSDWGRQYFSTVIKEVRQDWLITKASAKITVGSVQTFLDHYTKEHGGRIDYIHGSGAVCRLSGKDHTIGFLLPVMKKEELFPAVMEDGALPRKTFSMGHAQDKRYYTECRMIRVF